MPNLSDSPIKQGDSVALSYKTVPEQDMTGWEAQVMVKVTLDAAALIDKTFTTLSGDNMAVIGSLTPAETVALAVGTYVIVSELSNSGTGESKEIHDGLCVEEQGVF